MLQKGSIVRLSDNREYFVAESVVFDGVTYYYLATANDKTIDVMFVSCNILDGKKNIQIVSDEALLFSLTQLLQK